MAGIELLQYTIEIDDSQAAESKYISNVCEPVPRTNDIERWIHTRIFGKAPDWLAGAPYCRCIVHKSSIRAMDTYHGEQDQTDVTEMLNPWMSIKRAARYTGFSEKTVRRAIDAGHLVAFRTTRVWRVRKSDVDEWVEGSAEVK